LLFHLERDSNLPERMQNLEPRDKPSRVSKRRRQQSAVMKSWALGQICRLWGS